MSNVSNEGWREALFLAKGLRVHDDKYMAVNREKVMWQFEKIHGVAPNLFREGIEGLVEWARDEEIIED